MIAVSLVCSQDALRSRLQGDINAGKRTADIVERSIARIPLYRSLHTVKLDTTAKAVLDVAKALSCL